MTHFGMALGIITATVIGGAFFLDQRLGGSNDAAPRPAASSVSKADPAEAPAQVASADGGQGATLPADAVDGVADTTNPVSDDGKAAKAPPEKLASSGDQAARAP